MSSERTAWAVAGICVTAVVSLIIAFVAIVHQEIDQSSRERQANATAAQTALSRVALLEEHERRLRGELNEIRVRLKALESRPPAVWRTPGAGR